MEEFEHVLRDLRGKKYLTDLELAYDMVVQWKYWIFDLGVRMVELWICYEEEEENTKRAWVTGELTGDE